MTAFATADQLAATLGIATPTDSLVLAQWNTALDDASGLLRETIGQPIDAGTVTLTLVTDRRGVAEIWLVPITAITTVLDYANVAVDSSRWELRDQQIRFDNPCSTYIVTLNYGYATIPSEIVRWTKVLANAQIQAAAQGNLGLSTVTSVAIDDGKVTYSEAMTVALPDKTAQWLKATFGGPQ